MSLINKMLDDLEKRQAFLTDDQDMVLDGLCSARDAEIDSRGKGRPGLVVLGLLLVSGILLVFIKPPGFPDFNDLSVSNRTTPAVTEAIMTAQTGQAKPVDEFQLPEANAPVPEELARNPDVITFKLDDGLALVSGGQTAQINTATGTSIDDIRLESNGRAITVALHLPEVPRYQIYTLNAPDRTVIEIDNASYTGTLPDISRVAGVSGVRSVQGDDGTFRFVLETINRVFIESADLEKGGSGFTLMIQLVSQEPLPVATAPVVDESVVSDTTATKLDIVKTRTRTREASPSAVDTLYVEGYRLYREGRIVEGLDKLAAAVQQDAGHTKARLTLATCLIEQGQRDRAYSLLREGLKLRPEQTELARLLAQAMIDEDKPDAARDVLSASLPGVTKDPDYHALYAAVLQRLKQHKEAALTYRDILKLHPENSVWWMGLAISLEAMSRQEDALIAYRNALNGQSLAPDTHQYINQRIHILSRQLSHDPT
ncbi:MAG: hypothetical protein A2W28_03780 [Gammaproteobacteria bacterium RBG_16_51_14]|nr:MAG: hypothetical protein A2W28_03780 [Gammaproteobacteria bacterium RBG_16_51_14]